MKAIRVHTPGPEENLILEEVPVPEPGPGQAQVKIAVSGINFIDIYFRTGLYPAPERPFGLGMEAAGTVTAVGEGCVHVKVGDRVAYAMQRGSYAEYAVVPEWMLVPVPPGLELSDAAALMLQGMTVHYLTHSTFALQPGQTCLIHAAAGGVGLILTQVAKLIGATVIATTSTPEKGNLVELAGADHVIRYENFADEVRRLTHGKGVHVVYDSVGASTFEGSLNSLRPRGMMVTFGNASGPVPAVEPLLLSQKGSLFLTRPRLGDYCVDRDELLQRSSDVFRWRTDGHLPTFSSSTYAMDKIQRAHRDLASRSTSGKLLLHIG
ncbi:MAG: quinone oxidoreductase [Bryobacteraceae bacterium]|nr:quinone oxidoreductase [Bryobacteraceae bacterium]